MAINPLLPSTGNLPAIDLHAPARHKGVHGQTQNPASDDPASATAPLGSNQHLFSHLMDSAEQMIGINPASAAKKP